MYRFLWFLRGYICLEICGASPGWALNRLTAERIAFWNVRWMDSLTVRICIPTRRFHAAYQASGKAMCDCRLIKTMGLPKYIRRFFHRPVLIAMILLSVISVSILQQFVFFYQVIGNEVTPEDQILRELHSLGIGFGTYGPSIHPQWVKDHMLAALPQLEWVTVTQTGCHGRVIVRERTETPQTQGRKGFSNVVAHRGGIITEQNVFAGQAQFHVGDTVSEGEVLVSGIVDLERIYVLEQANAEIFARTWHDSTVVIPSTYTEKAEITRKGYAIWLVIGQNRIKIFGNSGISGAECDKMKKTKTLCLPGGLKLPISLDIETVRYYEAAEQALEEHTAMQMLSAAAEQRAIQQMQAGQILQRNYSISQKGRRYELKSTLECHEMIAKVIPGQWKNEDMSDD